MVRGETVKSGERLLSQKRDCRVRGETVKSGERLKGQGRDC